MNNIRPYHVDDGKFLGDMLLAEGLNHDDMGFATWDTYVYDDGELKGFYTYKIDHDIFPHLQHLCVGREYRNMVIARRLIRDFRTRMRVHGYLMAFINAPKCIKRVGELIQKYFRVKLYSTDKEHQFYLVRI